VNILNEKVITPMIDLVSRDGLIAFPNYWQMPAATEKAAYDSMANCQHRTSFEYIGFPWATLIDGLRGDANNSPEIMMMLKRVSEVPAKTNVRVSVAQHIHAIKFIEFFKACGITDLFWSHATHKLKIVDGIRLHPFPLFPAQTHLAVTAVDLNRPRRYLANFIGAYNSSIYLTNVREAIFNDHSEADLLIIKRNAWHFDRAVYEEQIKGLYADERRLLIEQQQTAEYLDAINDSWFTLCPSGSGPNSIRIFESLCLGSIPIVLTRDLRLPGPEALWEKAAIIEDDTSAGYSRALVAARTMSLDDRIEMMRYGSTLAKLVSPENYSNLLTLTE
jgi:hypothetical protein